MDELSAKMYAKPTVAIDGYREKEAEIKSACLAIFGRNLDADEIVELIGAPDGSFVHVRASLSDGSLELRVNCEWFGETNEYVIYVEAGKRIVEFANIHVKQEAPYLLETRILARQVRSFQRYGLDEIRLYAGGHQGGLGGYYVWPRLGFIMYLVGHGADLAAAGFPGIDNTLDLFEVDGGADWWYDHGVEGSARFLLDPKSDCCAALNSYLQLNGIEVYDDIND